MTSVLLTISCSFVKSSLVHTSFVRSSRVLFSCAWKYPILRPSILFKMNPNSRFTLTAQLSFLKTRSSFSSTSFVLIVSLHNSKLWVSSFHFQSQQENAYMTVFHVEGFCCWDCLILESEESTFALPSFSSLCADFCPALVNGNWVNCHQIPDSRASLWVAMHCVSRRYDNSTDLGTLSRNWDNEYNKVFQLNISSCAVRYCFF